MPELYELTATQLAAAIRAGETTAVASTEALLARIDALEPQLRAWVYLDRETALADARQRDEELAGGGAVGPLHGVPLGVKDIFYTAGIPTTAGSKVYADFIPEYDSTLLARLKAAGVIMLGKTVTTEFACLDPSETCNPWNPAHTPGGSSSGSAVAVAARMCPIALGSQTVGSVLRPASYNGVVGLKPTYGRVSRAGVVPVSWSLDTMGWLARSVADAALLLQAGCGPDPADPVLDGRPPGNYGAAAANPAPPRLGLITSFFMEQADEETQRHCSGVAQKLAAAGALVEEVTLPPSFDTAFADQRLIMSAEAAAFHQPMYETRAADYRPLLREMLRRGLEIDAVTYSQALERRLRFTADMRELAGRFDALLTPSTPTPAQADLSNTGNTMFQGPWTSCGLPAITLPSGLAKSGLPLGIQLIAGPFQEERLLSAAAWCEQTLGIELTPPIG